MRRRWLPSYVFAGWTAFVCVTRIRNAHGDAGAIALSLVFLAGAVAVVVGVRRDWGRLATGALAALTVAVWAIRTPMIWAHDHEVGFKVVHTVLAFISVGLAVWAVMSQRNIERERQATAAAPGLQELADR